MKLYRFKVQNYNESNRGGLLIYDADDEAITAWLKNNKTKAQLIPFH
jgi:UDP-N-acetylmuramoylalanine--D-glutamate ligase